MIFREKIANYVLGNVTRTQLPQLGLTGLKENLESESLAILAGMSDKDNTFEIENYFKLSLAELNTELPTKLEAAEILLKYYLKEMINSPGNAFELMTKIQNDIYYQIKWEELPIPKKKTYVGEELGLEHMYTWYRELQDFKDGSKLFYHNDLPRLEQQKKLILSLVEEANNLLQKLNQNTINAY